MSELKEIIVDLQKFIFAQKRYWLLPFLVLFTLLTVLTLLSHPLALAPLIYSIF